VKERSVPIRPGIEEHLVRGAMSLCEFGIYALIHIQADYRTGIWQGSAPRIVATAPRGVSLRQVQRALERFEELGYLKSFRAQGARGNTPYLIDKFTVRSGGLKGYRVNAAKSESWQRPFYELVAEDDAVPVTEGVTEHDALSRSKKKEVKRKNENPAAKPVPPADPRFQPFFSHAFESYRAKHQRPPIWMGKDKAGLKDLLRSQNLETLPLSRLTALWGNYSASTEPFTVKQADSLAYFCSNLDKFSDGPLLAVLLKGASNGKPSVGENMRTTLEAFRVTEQERTN
jgi:hypothetical protein